MSGSVFGKQLKISTWGESHGKALGVVLDGVPAGLELSEADIQIFLDRRKPGQSGYSTARREGDKAEILSGVFDGGTTGTPICIMIKNEDQHSKDYSDIASVYRPGHADFGYDQKYGFRDYRGGGRSSGRETVGRVAAGAVAAKILKEIGVSLLTYTESISDIRIKKFDAAEITKNPLYMPDAGAAKEAMAFLDDCKARQDSAGGVIACVVKGMPAGVGDPVFDKLDADLAKAVMSIGAVKGVEIGDGFSATTLGGLKNNDPFRRMDGKTVKTSNHSGGILGGMSDGDDIILRAAVKPTPSVAARQQTVNADGEEVSIEIVGRHDPVIVPRAVVVVESMVALTLTDALFSNMTARMDSISDFYRTRE